MNRFFFSSAFFFVCLFAFSGCAGGSKIDTLENRILSLEMENTRQKKTINDLKNNKDYAFLKAELEKHRVTVRRLEGEIEKATHKFSLIDNKNAKGAKEKEIKDLNSKFSEVSKRIGELEQYIGLEGSKELSDGTSKEIASDKDTGSDSRIEKEENTPEAIYKNPAGQFPSPPGCSFPC
jgi:predicted  nucleic acid-binding Zn-ribbon protein